VAIGIYSLKEVSPAASRWRRIAEPLMVVIGIAQPLVALPLLYGLYVAHTQDASGHSLRTWSIFVVTSLLLFMYGLHHRRPSIYAGNLVGLVTSLLMMNAILMHAR
jgi:predicted cation transporter